MICCAANLIPISSVSVSKVGCVDEGMGPEDQPMARLRWQDDDRWVDGRQVDVGCADYGDRVNWVLAYLASKVGEPTVR